MSADFWSISGSRLYIRGKSRYKSASFCAVKADSLLPCSPTVSSSATTTHNIIQFIWILSRCIETLYRHFFVSYYVPDDQNVVLRVYSNIYSTGNCVRVAAVIVSLTSIRLRWRNELSAISYNDVVTHDIGYKMFLHLEWAFIDSLCDIKLKSIVDILVIYLFSFLVEWLPYTTYTLNIRTVSFSTINVLNIFAIILFSPNSPREYITREYKFRVCGWWNKFAIYLFTVHILWLSTKYQRWGHY